MDYSKKLDELYGDYKEGIENLTRLGFLSDNIFDFTTYDNEVSEQFARGMLEVLECLLLRKTFEYQAKHKGAYMNYLLMVNMPFLAGKLDWGTSIRGAWLDNTGDDSYQICSDLIVPQSDLVTFTAQLIEWAKITN